MSFPHPTTTQPYFYRFSHGKEQPLIQIIEESNLVLLDNSALSIDSSLCRNLYDANNSSKLDKLIPALSSQHECMALFLGYSTTYSTIQTIPLIIDEIRSLQTNFNQSYTYHHNLWQKTITDSTQRNFISQRTHKKEQKKEVHELRAYNKRLEKISRTLNHEDNIDFNPGPFLPYSIKLLKELDSICHHFTQNLKIYDGPIISIPSIGKSSPADCALVGAALGKSAEQYHTSYKISIFTKDFDIPQLFYNYLSTDRTYLNLFSNISIYMPCRQDKTLVQKIKL